MRKNPNCLRLSALLLAVCLLNVGCSGGGGENHDLPPAASPEKILAGKAERAKPLLDALEKAKPEERQDMADSPRMATRLKEGADDPDTKARIERLGIKLK